MFLLYAIEVHGGGDLIFVRHEIARARGVHSSRGVKLTFTLFFIEENNTSTEICPHLSAPLFDMAGAAFSCFASNFHCFYIMKKGGDNSAGTFLCKINTKCTSPSPRCILRRKPYGKATFCSVGADFANYCSRLGAACDSVIKVAEAPRICFFV